MVPVTIKIIYIKSIANTITHWVTLWSPTKCVSWNISQHILVCALFHASWEKLLSLLLVLLLFPPSFPLFFLLLFLLLLFLLLFLLLLLLFLLLFLLFFLLLFLLLFRRSLRVQFHSSSPSLWTSHSWVCLLLQPHWSLSAFQITSYIQMTLFAFNVFHLL